MGNGCCKDDTKEKYTEMEHPKNRLEHNARGMQQELKKLTDQNESLKTRLEATQQRHQQVTADQTRQYEEEIKKLNQQKKRLEGNAISMKQQLKDLGDENETLKTRLSAAIGAKVRDGNPNIADLSDMNRPTNLANEFSELYDNKWTDAYDVITKTENMSEKDACLLLCNIFCEIYKLCITKADEDLKQLNDVMFAFYGVDDTQIRNQFKDKRKEHHHYGNKKMEKVVRQKVKTLVHSETLCESEKMNAYINECSRIAWLMSIQDPPVKVDTNIRREGEKLNTNIFRAYTKSGTEIDFIVWPAVYLATGEGLLAKGVAQGRPQVTTQPQTMMPQHDSTDKGKGESEQDYMLDSTKGQRSSTPERQQNNTAPKQHHKTVYPNTPGDPHVPAQTKVPVNQDTSSSQQQSVKNKHEAPKSNTPMSAVQQQTTKLQQTTSGKSGGQSKQDAVSAMTPKQTSSAQKQHSKTTYGTWHHKVTAQTEHQTAGIRSNMNQSVSSQGKQKVTSIKVGSKNKS